MLKNIFTIILAFISLALSQAVRYTEVFFIDFTETPQSLQLFVSWIFLFTFVTLILTSLWWFYE